MTQKRTSKNFLHELPFEIICKANEEKLDHDRTVDEPNTPIETLKNFVNRKHLAYDLTPKFSNEVDYLKPQDCYFHLSRSQTKYQTDRENKKNTTIEKNVQQL